MKTPARRILFRFIVVCVFLSPLVLSSCCNLSFNNTKTYGTIMVDHPEVFTRERLVTRRHAETQWLEGKLEGGYQYTTQGFREVKEFSGFVGKLKASVDPLSGALTTAQTNKQISDTQRQQQQAEWDHQEARLEHRKAMLELRKEIDKLKNPSDDEDPEKTTTKADDDTNDDDTDDTTKDDTNEATEETIDDLKSGMAELRTAMAALPSAAGLTKSDAQLSSIDKVRDEKAYLPGHGQRHAPGNRAGRCPRPDGITRFTPLNSTPPWRRGDHSQTFAKVKLTLMGDLLKALDDPKNDKVKETYFINLFDKWLTWFEKELDKEAIAFQYRLRFGLLSQQELISMQSKIARIFSSQDETDKTVESFINE